VARRIQMTPGARLDADERVFSCPKKIPGNWPAAEKWEPGTMPIHLESILINKQVAIAATSGEIVTKIYWHLKKATPLANTIMITIANNRLGYIADDAAYDRPVQSVNRSPFARGCAENGIVNGLVEMISQQLER
jgi:neutral ceramidase